MATGDASQSKTTQNKMSMQRPPAPAEVDSAPAKEFDHPRPSAPPEANQVDQTNPVGASATPAQPGQIDAAAAIDNVPAGSSSSSHGVDTPSSTVQEGTKISEEEFDTWTPDLKRAAAIAGLAPNQSWRTKGGAGWRSKRGGTGPGSQKWKHARGNDWWNGSW